MALQHSAENVVAEPMMPLQSFDSDSFAKKQIDAMTSPATSNIHSVHGGINVYGNKGGIGSKNNKAFIFTTQNVDSSE